MSLRTLLAYVGRASFVLLVVLAAARMHAEAVETSVEVAVQEGVLSGVWTDGIASFKGIPYASPPVGVRRWRAPEAPATWSGKRAATNFSPACAQLPYPSGSMFAQVSEATSEDCLYLNVWTAKPLAKKSAPVMVWIHGGGLTRGSGASAIYDGAALAEKGVVLVTINYRLGPFGYFAHPQLSDEAQRIGGVRSSGNYGTLDQVAALRWVRNNIAAFGGDPDNVTIFGESAGSWSVNHMTASPLAAGLFHRAIGQSGAKFDPMPELAVDRGDVPSAETQGRSFAEHLGAESLDALRSMTAAEVLAGFESFQVQGFSQPNVDGHVFPDHIANIFNEGKHNRVDLMVGSNADEGTNLLPPPKDAQAAREFLQDAARDRLGDVERVYGFDEDHAAAYYGAFRDVVFTWPMRRWADLATTAGDNVWLYYFTYEPPAPMDGKLGAYHAAEIRYAFNNETVTFDDTDATAAERALGEAMSDYWVNFAREGNPGKVGDVRWPLYQPEKKTYLEIGDTIRARDGGFLEPQLEQIRGLIADSWRRQQAQ